MTAEHPGRAAAARLPDAYAEPDASTRRWTRRAGVLTGVGLMVGVDQVVFHQLLGWHHLDSRGSERAGLVSDGLLHAAELVVLVVGLAALVVLRRRGPLPGRVLVSSLLLGLGGFQVVDGTVVHKVLGLHQVREGLPPGGLLPYDLAWTGGGVLLLLAGVLVARGGRPAPGRQSKVLLRTEGLRGPVDRP